LTVHRNAARALALSLPLALVIPALAAPSSAAKKVKPAAAVLTAGPSGLVTTSDATFAWTSTTVGATFQCSLDGARASACTSPKAYSGLRQGAHTFVVRTYATGPTSASTSRSWTVDTLAPPAPHVSPVAGPTRTTSAQVSFYDDEVVHHFSCAVDSGAPATCTSPFSTGTLAEGQHSVTVSAHDAAGNSTSASTSWEIDLTAPSVPTVVPPASPTRTNPVPVTFSSDGAASFTCSHNHGPQAPCASGAAFAGPDGLNTVEVRAVDAAGNVADVAGTASWVVDTTAPATPSLVTGPADLTNQTGATFSFAGAPDTASWTCTVDATPVTCDSTAVVSGLAEGAHTVSVTAADALGNTSAPLTRTWTIDLTAPTPADVTNGPAPLTNVTSAGFDIATPDDSEDHFSCALDGAAPELCASPVSYSGLGDGEHVIAVRAQDAAGNSTAATTYRWVVDTTPPAVPVLASPVVATTDGTATLTLVDAARERLTCSLDGLAASACTSPVTYSGLAVGSHTIDVVAYDVVGNASPALRATFSVPPATPPVVVTPPVIVTPLDKTAPSASLVVPTTLTVPAVATFSEDVRGITAVNTRIAKTTGAVVPTALRCYTYADALVPCTGSARRARLTPVSPLLPGERYYLQVLGGVRDTADNALVPVGKAFRAQLVQQENSLAAQGRWRTVTTASAHGGSYAVATLPGATASRRFVGTNVTWYSVSGPSFGTAKVYVDGKYRATVNAYSATARYKVARSITGLTNAAHTLTVVLTGQKGSTLGTGTAFAFDAVKTGTALVVTPALVTSWSAVVAAPASAGRYAVADRVGESFVMGFRGTRITWTTVTAKNMGRAKVYVDGVYKGTYDSFSSTTKYGVRRAWAVADGVHTLTIVPLGTHHTGATGNRVVVDALTVG
jgi:hypothetical protein